MFTFHKSDTQPSSRQSSVDSPNNSSLSFMSTSDAWIDDQSHGPMQHIEVRQKSQASKRGSVFNLRSRSNTSLSTASSVASVNSPSMSPRPESPHVFGSFARPSQGEPSASRKSIFRGKKGNRSSEAPGFDQEDGATSKRASVLRKITRRDNHLESTCMCI